MHREHEQRLCSKRLREAHVLKDHIINAYFLTAFSRQQLIHYLVMILLRQEGSLSRNSLQNKDAKLINFSVIISWLGLQTDTFSYKKDTVL